MNKIPSISIVGGKNRFGFSPLAASDSDSPALAAAKKSRQAKNRKLLKIGALVVVVSAVLAGLTAFFLTREDSLASIFATPNMFKDHKIQNVQEVKSVAHSNEVFGKTLYDLLKNDDGNLVMSPFSVSAVMAMVSAGAKDETLQQILTGMSLPTSMESLKLGYQDAIPALRSSENFTLEAANTVFSKDGFEILEEFKENLHRYFHAGVQPVDFSDTQHAARMINNWVQKMTADKIQNLIKADMLDPVLTRLVLVNAIYFKGDWATKFDPERTQEKDFTLSPSSTVKVPMMSLQEKFQFAYLSSLESLMVELPYKGDRIVMQILLPEEKNGLQQVEEKLKDADLQEMFAKEGSLEKVHLQLPKFKLEKRIPLTQHLASLGMKNMFSGGLADFSGIDGSRDLYVSEVVQKAFIEVNEEGSEAAAATGAVMMMRSMPAPPARFVADHPFLFFIRDKTTGMLLFQGRVNQPKENVLNAE